MVGVLHGWLIEVPSTGTFTRTPWTPSSLRPGSLAIEIHVVPFHRTLRTHSLRFLRLPICQDPLLQLGTEGQAQKDDRHRKDELPQGESFTVHPSLAGRKEGREHARTTGQAVLVPCKQQSAGFGISALDDVGDQAPSWALSASPSRHRY